MLWMDKGGKFKSMYFLVPDRLFEWLGKILDAFAAEVPVGTSKLHGTRGILEPFLGIA